MDDITVNYQYKDRVFRDLFGAEERKENLLSLYNALNGTDYQNPDDLEITTIEDAIYMGMKNDVSCIIDNCLSLFEHQSTYNPNMPLRGLLYFGKLYDKFTQVNKKNIYSSRLIQISAPQYYIFYNGKQELPDRMVLRLSDAFEVPPRDGEFEWTATMLNINAGKNKKLMAHCQVLQEYALFVDIVRQEAKETKDIAAAVTKAVDICISRGILKDYLLERKSEVIDMVITEYDEKKTMAAIAREEFEEGRAEGIKEGEERGEQKTLISLVRDGLLPAAEAAKRLSMSEKNFLSML